MFESLTTPRPGWEMAPYIAAIIVIFVVVMAIIHPLANSVKKRITMLLAFLGGSFYLLEFLLPERIKIGSAAFDNPFTPYVSPLGSALRLFLTLALMLGIVNLFRVNGRTLFRRRTGSWYALAFFFGFFAMVTVWALKYYHPGVSDAIATTAAGVPRNFVPGTMGQYAGWYNVVYNGGFNSLGSTMFSLLAFFIVSAAYRAFRVRSAESVLLLGSAIVMMLGLTPLGTAFITGKLPLVGFASNFRLENVTEWILLVMNAAAQRALLFGVAVGLMATSLRIWLSLERGQFFDAEL